MSIVDDLKTALRGEESRIRQAWAESVTANQRQPRAYANTLALLNAVDIDATIRSIKILEVNGVTRITGAIVLSGSLVLSAHKTRQVPLVSLGSSAAYKVQTHRANPKTLGVVGSMQPQRKPYLLEYLASGANVSGQPLVYKYLGQPPLPTIRTGPNVAMLVAFAKKLGFVFDSTPTKGSIYGGTLRLSDTGNSIIKDAAKKVMRATNGNA